MATNTRRGIFFKALATLLGATALFAPSRALATDMDVDGVADENDAVPCDPRAVSVAYAPAENQSGLLVFEDSWPSDGDLDFNDIVVAYNYIFFLNGAGAVSSMQASINLLAAGGTVPNSVRLHLPVPSGAASTIQLNTAGGTIVNVTPMPNESDLVISLVDEVHAAMGGDTVINSSLSKASVPGVPINLYVQFTTPVALDVTTAPFDVYLERTQEPGHQIHQVIYPGTDTMDSSLFGTADDGSTPTRHFIDASGLPFALAVPITFNWPDEGVPISIPYPDITPWATSGGATNADWYQTDVQATYTWTGGAGGTPAPVALLIGPTDPSEDVRCAPWHGTVQFGLAPQTWAYGTASDPSGDVFAAGYLYPNSANDDVAYVTKYDGSKNLLWTTTLPGSNGFSVAYAVATDSEGNAYVSGQVDGAIAGEASVGYQDPFVAKLDTNGNIVWVTHANVPGSSYSEGWGVAVGPDGSIYSAGYADFSNVVQPYVAKLGADGSLQWSSPVNLGRTAYAFGVAVDASSDVFISGYGPSGNEDDAFTAKVTSSGNLQWAAWDDSYYSLAFYSGTAADANENVYSTGYRAYESCSETCTSCGFFCESCSTVCNTSGYYAPLWKYNGGGALQWIADVGLNSEGLGAAVDSAGNVVFGGIAWAGIGGQTFTGTGDDYFVAKVNPAGSILWTREGGGGSGFAEGFGVCVDPSSSVFLVGDTNGDVTGTGANPSSQYQAFVAKYDTNGNLQ
jgi:LruC domain-containing protein